VCGIAGFTHRHRKPGAEPIQRATASLIHRGPDQQGTHQSEHVSLGAVRLKIIDLRYGNQPMRSDDGDTVLVFNGEIYNHAELRRELESLGRRFTSQSDTEVVLRAFLEWDTGFLSRLCGMFALGIWTESRKRLLLARDRMGIKPLYFSRQGDELYFGSELKAILIHPEIPRRLDFAGLSYYLSLNYVPCPHTLVEGIEKLPPGHWLEWRDGRVRIEPYWQLEFRPRRDWTLPAACEQLDALLKQSVRQHLISDVPLGVWMSGGVDSSTILHYASEAHAGRLKTFSISFRGRSFDETSYIRQIASRYATDHHEFDVNPSVGLDSAIEEFAYYSDEPSADAGALPVWFLARMSRQYMTVALSGEGADELFGGYVTYLADRWTRLARVLPAPLLRLAVRAVQRWPVSDEKIGFDYRLRRFLEGSLLPPDEAHAYWNGAFSEGQKRDFYLKANGASVRGLFGALPAESQTLTALNRYMWFDQRYYLPDDILYKVDRMSMAHSLEVRPPFLDHRIAEFAATLPENFKVRGGRMKVVLKELMKDRLPPSVLRKKKIGLDIPAHDWFRGPLRALLLDTLTPEAVEQTRLFRAAGVQSLVNDHLERRANLGYHLWGLMILFLWMKRWRIETSAVPEESRGTLASVFSPT
jgi:asparagine synthase (glutamine-hydrolysing)